MTKIRVRHALPLAATTAAVLAVTWSLISAGAASASTLGGTATITDPSLNPLSSGGSTTNFSVSLPANAACSGDTQNDGYHVESYLVPQGTTVTSITFSNHPSTGYGFADNTGKYYGSQNTAPTTGQIVGIPTNFEWGSWVSADGVPLATFLYNGTSGIWEAGIACANSSGTLTDYWNTEVTFTASQSDPNGFTWAAVPGVPGSTPEESLAVVLPVGAVAVLGGGLAYSRRRASREGKLAQESVGS